MKRTELCYACTVFPVLGQKTVCQRVCRTFFDPQLQLCSCRSQTGMPPTGWYSLPDCHTVFAQMASQQGAHPSKLETCLLPLTRRLCRPKWQVVSCSWDAKLHNVHKKMNYLLAILWSVPGAEGDGTTSPSCATANGSTNAYNASL